MITLWVYIAFLAHDAEWGFFGHRLINRLAVYTVPTEMMDWYKPHIDYLSDHAVDPDKRRYATKHEAVRHYIDLDQWGTLPFDHMPRYWDKVLALNLQLFSFDAEDTLYCLEAIPVEKWSDTIADYDQRLQFVREYYQDHYYDDEPHISLDSLRLYFPNFKCDHDVVYIGDAFSAHGIVPYHLQAMQYRLTRAFADRDLEKVLRLSAEMGHYIADACVPLHTTKNYNGQLTDQIGIHAFWESRIPELLAEDEFDMVVGGASYIHDPAAYFWGLVFDSHRLVNDVLSLEKQLSQTYPTDQQYCFEDRLNQNIRTQCPEYAKAYHLAMDNMVEDRFRVAVKAVGDAWYTAWIDAGQPALPPSRLVAKRSAEDESLDRAVQAGKSLGREHEN